MRRLLLAIALVGCSEDEITRHVEIQITSEEPIDRIVVRAGPPASCPSCEAPLTPRMLASGVTTPPRGSVRYGRARDTALPAGTTEHVHKVFEYFGVNDDRYVALGFRGGVLVAAGTVEVELDHADTVRATLALTRAALDETEVWGRLCVAVPGLYLVDALDGDCDGVTDSQDCELARFCDPKTTACATPRCEPCLDDACSLGTTTMCHNAPDGTRTITCETSATCGERASCLPADSCDLRCDDLYCLERAWWDPAAPAPSPHCTLPVTTGDDPRCPNNGSAILVQLPHAGCANAEVLTADGRDWLVDVTPACLLRLRMVSRLSAPRYATVAFETGATSATVRLGIDPVPGCGAPGACEAIAPAATCGL